MDPITILTKAIGLGIKAWNAYCDEGLDSKDLDALNQVVAGVAGMTSGGTAPGAAAAQVGLIMASFGRAFEGHWVGTRTLERPGWIKRWLDREEKDRDQEIQTRLRMARLGPGQVGDRSAGAAEVAAVGTLVGDPRGTPYYRELWRVFTDRDLDLTGDQAPMTLDPENDDKHRFERHFLLAYHQGLASNAGKPVRDYLGTLEKDQARLIRDVTLADLATWRDHHVFGNVRPEVWDEDHQLPFLSLGTLYVEPEATVVPPGSERSTQEPAPEPTPEPITRLLDAWLADPEGETIAVIRADFGMGKSLTARTWACQLARRWRDDTTGISLDAWQPVFIDCGKDILGQNPELPTISQRARKRHASELGISLSTTDPALAMPAHDQRTVFVLDGLDEVVLGQRELDALFVRLRDHATARHRVLVLSRPGVLPEQRRLKGVRVLELGLFRGGQDPGKGQIAAWLKRWNAHARKEKPAIAVADIAGRDLLELAATPILLFMIAHSWDEHQATGEIRQAQVYETFMLQMARGKHELDQAGHTPVYDAAIELRRRLVDDDLLDDSAAPHEAMLWLLARLAWEETCLAWDHRIEQRLQRGGGELDDEKLEPPILTRRIIGNVLGDDLRVDGEAARTVEIGLLLTLQHDSMSDRDRLHFGHKSFREFLVARYWADRLRKLAGGGGHEWAEHESHLAGGRLLLSGNRSFEYLCQMLRSTSDRPCSPLAWNAEQRGKVRDWAEKRFNDETLRCDPPRARRRDERGPLLRHDRSPLLREAALAVGSEISVADGLDGLKADSPWTLRSLLTWFWYTREPVWIHAPKARLAGSMISGTFRVANFAGADLSHAVMDRCQLEEAAFQYANLQHASLQHANLHDADLSGADLRHASLQGAHLQYAWLVDANLRGANLLYANLSNTQLQLADLQHADLHHAQLYSANLHGTNLHGADLQHASLDDALYNESTTFPEHFDPAKEGMESIDD